MKRAWLTTAALCLALAWVPFSAARAAYDLEPAETPLAALFLPQIGSVDAILRTGQARAAGLSDRDHSLSLPGLGRIASIRSFLAALQSNGAGDFWICLLDLNNSALGWRWRANGPAEDAADALLRQAGINPDSRHLTVTKLENGESLVVLAKNRNSLATLFRDRNEARKLRGDQDWRNGFAEAAAADSGLTLWLNPRPVTAVLALAGGVDLRSLLQSRGIPFPSALTLRLRENGDRLGFALIAHGRYSPDGGTGSAQSTMACEFPTPPPLRLDFRVSEPERLADALPRIPAPPGVEFKRFIPESASIGIWIDPAGQPLFGLAASLGAGRDATESFKRLGSWLEVLVSSPSSALQVEFHPDPALMRLATPQTTVSAWMKNDQDGSERLFLTNGDFGDAPEALNGRISEDLAATASVQWAVDLDPETKGKIADLLHETFSPKLPFKPDIGFWTEVVGTEEQGSVRLDNDAIRLESPRGAALWLAAVAVLEAERSLKPLAKDGAALAAKRLRFLLDAAWKSRYRAITPANPMPGPLPTSLSQLAFTDSDGEAWLDNALPPFPGLGKPNHVGMSRVSASRLDGYSYRLDAAGGEWFITATPAGGGLPTLRINAEGVMTESAEPGGWRPHRESILP